MQPESPRQIQKQQPPPNVVHDSNVEAIALATRSVVVQRAYELSLAGHRKGAVAAYLRQAYPGLSEATSLRVASLPVCQRAREHYAQAPEYARALAKRNSPLVMRRQVEIATEGSERNATPAANVVLKVAGLLQEQPTVQLNAETIQVLQMLRDAPSRGAARSKSEEDGVKGVDGEHVKE